jgi:hypothetical protein
MPSQQRAPSGVICVRWCPNCAISRSGTAFKCSDTTAALLFHLLHLLQTVKPQVRTVWVKQVILLQILLQFSRITVMHGVKQDIPLQMDT